MLLPNSMYYNSNNISGGNDITKGFAQYFSNVFNDSSPLQNVSDTSNISLPSVDFNLCVLTLSDIYN